MKESLDISQSQQTVQRLSPRQVQYVRLLEMTAPEIEEELRRQLDDNPALEVAEPVAADDSDHDDNPAADIAEQMAGMGDDPDDDPVDRMPAWASSASSDYAPMQIADDGPNLHEYLEEQIREMSLPEDAALAAHYIIGNIDENGYMTRTLAAIADDIAIATGRDIAPQTMRQAFDAVRSLEPAGVGAVDLRDCLLLQLRRIKPSTFELKIAQEVIADYFDLFSKKHFDRLQMQLGLDRQDELRAAIEIIRGLNPKPGSAIAPSGALLRLGQISPDVAVEQLDNGRFSVSLASPLPQLQVERSFQLDTAQKPRNRAEKEAQSFIRLKRDDAEAFIGAIRQRSQTLLDVTEAIVRRQPDFFATGEKSRLKPMILRDIAADTGLDLSAVSRATAGKYVATPMGVYPLKMFFNEATGSEADTSAHQLMHAMKDIIDAEDKNHPLSDLAIQEAMEARGFKLARRTVTKYREKLGLPVGRLRKKI